MKLKPSLILYSQDNIGKTFRDGRSLSETMRQLLAKEVTPESIEAIEVTEYEGCYYAMTGNRRLFLYKELEAANLLSYITVSFQECDFFNRYEDKVEKLIHETVYDGTWVRVRGGNGVEAELDAMVKRHCELRVCDFTINKSN